MLLDSWEKCLELLMEARNRVQDIAKETSGQLNWALCLPLHMVVGNILSGRCWFANYFREMLKKQNSKPKIESFSTEFNLDNSWNRKMSLEVQVIETSSKGIASKLVLGWCSAPHHWIRTLCLRKGWTALQRCLSLFTGYSRNPEKTT